MSHWSLRKEEKWGWKEFFSGSWEALVKKHKFWGTLSNQSDICCHQNNHTCLGMMIRTYKVAPKQVLASVLLPWTDISGVQWGLQYCVDWQHRAAAWHLWVFLHSQSALHSQHADGKLVPLPHICGTPVFSVNISVKLWEYWLLLMTSGSIQRVMVKSL